MNKAFKEEQVLNNFVIYSVQQIIQLEQAVFLLEQQQIFAYPDCQKGMELEKNHLVMGWA
jgi:hypothetical protein